MTRNLLLSGAFLAAALMVPATFFPAHAVPATAEEVAQVLGANGVEDIEISAEDGRDTMISASLDIGDGEPFVFFTRLMRCDNENACATVMMFANFDMNRPAKAEDYKLINDYNASYPYGRVYLFDDESTGNVTIGVDYTVDLEDENEFGDNEVATFGIIVGSFFEHMMSQDET